MIDHEYGSLTGEGPCSRLVLVVEDEAPLMVALEDGEVVQVIDDRSIYQRCDQPPGAH